MSVGEATEMPPGIPADLGWLGVDPIQQRAAQAFPTLRQAAPYLFGMEPTEPIIIYKAMKDVTGDYLKYPAQEIGDCLIAGSMVLGETIKPIEAVEVGDMVWTGQGKLTRVISTRALQTMKPLVRIHAKGTLPTTLTADHLCLAYHVPVINGKRVTKPYYDRIVNGGPRRRDVIATYEAMEPEWVPAGDLTEDHYLLAPTKYEPIPPPRDDLLARLLETPRGRWLLGHFLGDGHASGGSVEFTISVRETSDALIETLTTLGYRPTVDAASDKAKSWRIRVHSRELVACFRRHFYDAAKAKAFPGWAVGDPDFVAGLFDADGHDVPNGRAVTTTSLSIVNGLTASLRALGFNPAVQEAKRSDGVFENAKPLYVVEWILTPQKHPIWRNEDYVCHRVKKIDRIEGPTTVYDIGVADEHHSFIANGLIDHNCVGFGHAHGNDILQCVEIVLGEGSEFRETSTEGVYGMSREIAGINSGGDGSYGSAAVEAMTKWGVVSREMLGPDGPYSGSRAKQWGGRSGVPQAVKTMAAKYKLGSAAKITDWESLVAAVRNGYPVSICSNQGFTLQRDEQGFCRAKGRWAHCMVIGGVRFDRPGACILQSWGVDTPSGPTVLDQPSYSFWADRDTVENILSQGDSWALAKAANFVERVLPPSWDYSSAA